MTQVAAICKSLLDGQVLSIMTGYKLFACTNLPREISRSIEQKFGVVVSKERIEFVSKYGQFGFYFRYHLNATEYNKPGIEKMRRYVKEQSNVIPKTDNEKKELQKFLADLQEEKPEPITRMQQLNLL